MRKISFIIISTVLLLSHGSLIAQVAAESAAVDASAAPVKSLEFEERTAAEYSQQSEYWKNVVAASPNNEMAWLNYYKSSRYESYTEHSHKVSKEDQKQLDDIVTRLTAAIPNSFAAHYASYLNGDKSTEAFSHLRVAYQMNPNEAELFDDMLCLAVIDGNTADITSFSNKISGSGLYNAAEVEYNRNVLNSLEQNAVLITYGNVDTYPIIMMQNLQNFRKDVTVVCLDWLGNQKYKEQVASMLSLKAESVSYEKIVSTTTRSVYVALTVSPEMIRKFSQNLYCTGLAMKYSRSALQNMESLVYNWEFLFSKNKIQTSDAINRNYLLPLVQLYQYYSNKGNAEQAKSVQEIASQISARFGVNKTIQKLID